MQLITCIDKCLIPKLAKNVEHSEAHEEYETRKVELNKNFDKVLNGIKRCGQFRENLDNIPKILASVFILYKDLLSKGPWHSEEMEQCASVLEKYCKQYFWAAPEDFLKCRHLFGNVSPQMVFDECMLTWQLQLTANDFKKHPSAVEVFCSVIDDISEYPDLRGYLKMMQISLIMVDDYNHDYKKKGLKCCAQILKNLKMGAIEDGNYYEVIYASLIKAFVDRDIEVTRLVIDCLQEWYKVLPPECEFKITACFELFNYTLNNIQAESNLYRKAALFRFTKSLIEANGVNCVARNMFQSVICYNLGVCCNKGVDDIMLLPIILCLEEWLKHCWCVWKFYSGHWVLSSLFKLLYICKDDMVERIVNIIATLLTLCTTEERQKVLTLLQETKNSQEVHLNDQFKDRLNLHHPEQPIWVPEPPVDPGGHDLAV
ncbi:TELO2-interacting protein 2-like [Phthorimaea operculella]|nr:TELO2-interacting protein 2-like [Phthorimaea operculella]